MAMTNYKARLKNITTFIFDFDGVMTDGSVIFTTDGQGLRVVNVKDGYALKEAVRHDFRVVVISGGNSLSMKHRMDALDITDYFLGVPEKLPVFREYLKNNHIKAEEVLYMGDDIPDYLTMREVGIATCPVDAVEEIQSIAHYISHIPGGRGCVRDVIEQVLKAQGLWMTDDAHSW